MTLSQLEELGLISREQGQSAGGGGVRGLAPPKEEVDIHTDMQDIERKRNNDEGKEKVKKLGRKKNVH